MVRCNMCMEIYSYLDILKKEEVNLILSDMGIDEKQSKKLLK